MTPREALEQSGQIPVNGCGYGAKSQIDAILTALAPFLIPDNCMMVCKEYTDPDCALHPGKRFCSRLESCPLRKAGYGTGAYIDGAYSDRKATP